MCSELKNISIKAFFALEEGFEEYHNVLKYLNPKPVLKGNRAKKIQSFSYGEVRAIIGTVQSPNFESIIEMLCKVFNLKKRQVYRISVVDFYHAFNWIKQEIKVILKKEQVLNSKPNGKLIQAGIKKLNVFGELNTLIALGKQFGKSPTEVQQWSYRLVFSILYHEKTVNEIDKNYNNLISNK